METPERGVGAGWIWLFAICGVLAVILVGLRFVVFNLYSMPSASMQPSLQQGQLLWVLTTRFDRPPRRGDVVIFAEPSQPSFKHVSRLIGLPGEHVQLQGGSVYIDGKALLTTPRGSASGALPEGDGPVARFEETTSEGRSFLIQRSQNAHGAEDTGVYVIPSHCYFVLGDNRDNALDSRFDSGLTAGDPKLHGCRWDEQLDDKVGMVPGPGYVPQADLVGRVLGRGPNG